MPIKSRAQLLKVVQDYSVAWQDNYTEQSLKTFLLVIVFWSFSAFFSQSSLFSGENLALFLLIASGCLLAVLEMKRIDKTIGRRKGLIQKVIISSAFASSSMFWLAVLLIRISFESLYSFTSVKKDDPLMLTYWGVLLLSASLSAFYAPKSYSFPKEEIERWATKVKLPLILSKLKTSLIGIGVLAGILFSRSQMAGLFYAVSFATFLLGNLFAFLGFLVGHRWFIMSQALKRGELTTKSISKKAQGGEV